MSRNRIEREELKVLREIEKDLDKLVKPRLSFVKISFGGTMAQGPVTLSQGQSTTATVLYFDQTGAPMPDNFVPPAVTFAIDNPAIASSVTAADSKSDAVGYVAAGVANLKASVTSAEGLALSDTETVTCLPPTVPTPVLSSIKVDFSTPTP
jgi:hypothetical protein